MPDALVPTLAPTSVPDLICAFLDGRSPSTLTAYSRDLDGFARFLTGSRQEALGQFFSQPAPAANADVLRYRHQLVARHLAPATVNRRLAAIRSLTKLARLLGVVTWAVEVQDVPQETLRDTREAARVDFDEDLAGAIERTRRGEDLSNGRRTTAARLTQ